MAESAHVRPVEVRQAEASDFLHHSATVRVTHWITTISFLLLLLSGIGILLAHPRLYWGEAGGVGAPSLIDLPLPFVLDMPIRGPGRYLHFLSAWILILTGLVYVVSGFVTHHFHKHFLPDKSQLRWNAIRQVVSDHTHFNRAKENAASYNLLQRMTYLAVIFGLVPLMIWTGLAMSPGFTSVFPAVVRSLGGHQAARTIHFFVAVFLVVFLIVHITMVSLAGFKYHVAAMITGRPASRTDTDE